MAESSAAIPSESALRIQVRLFAAYRETVGTGRIETAVPAGARVSDLLGTLRAQYPGLAATQGLIAVNREYVGEQFALHDGDEVALIPPVSGGV